MANEAHLEILKQGVEAWNLWRKNHPEITHPDLSWSDLSGRNLMWANLSGCDLSWSDLSGCNLILAELGGADLSRANLTKCDLTTAILDNARLHNANITGAYFFRASLRNADLHEAEGNKAIFDSCSLANTNFRGATLRGARFRNVNLQNSDFTGADLEGVQMDEPEENGADLRAAGRTGNGRWLRIAMSLALVSLLGLAGYFWMNWRGSVEINVAKAVHPRVLFDGKWLQPAAENETTYQYRLDGLIPGKYPLVIYSTQLQDFNTHEFVRFKRFNDTLNVSLSEKNLAVSVTFDTLYSIRKITSGVQPNISPDGQKVIFLRKSGKKNGAAIPSMWFYALDSGRETQIKLKDPSLYSWDWDRPFLRSQGKHIFLSAFQHSERRSVPFMIDATTGEVIRIPLELRRYWLKYLPMVEDQQLIVENNVFSLDGTYLKSFQLNSLYNNELYYGGKRGFVVLSEASEMEGNGTMLECLYVNYETLEAQVLFEVPRGRTPFISAANNAKRVVVTEYNGITREFISTIQLWSDGVTVRLTGHFSDGERQYADGSKFHKTEACADDAGENIVYEYENSIYLIHIPRDVTIEELALANLPDSMQQIASTDIHNEKM